MFYDNKLCLSHVPGSRSMYMEGPFGSQQTGQVVDISEALQRHSQGQKVKIEESFAGTGVLSWVLQTDDEPSFSSADMLYTSFGQAPSVFVAGFDLNSGIQSAGTYFPSFVDDRCKQYLNMLILPSTSVTAGRFRAAVVVDDHADHLDLGL